MWKLICELLRQQRLLNQLIFGVFSLLTYQLIHFRKLLSIRTSVTFEMLNFDELFSNYNFTRKIRQIASFISWIAQKQVNLTNYFQVTFAWKIRQIASFISIIEQNQVNLTSYFQIVISLEKFEKLRSNTFTRILAYKVTIAGLGIKTILAHYRSKTHLDSNWPLGTVFFLELFRVFFFWSLSDSCWQPL